MAAFGINGRKGWAALLATHPSLDARIEALRQGS
jgi:Zn-dependent protease with chaperone function